MGTTPTLALPYPEAADPPDVPTDIHELATQIEAVVPKITFGTTPPASPRDGDLWLYSLAGGGVVWEFRYNSGSASANKWEFIGGGDLLSLVNTQETTATTGSWLDLATVGPSFTVPRAGDYDVTAGAGIGHGAASATVQIGIAVGATNPANQSQALAGTGFVNAIYSVVASNRLTLAAGDEIRVRYINSTAGTAIFNRRWLRVRPVRVS